MLNDWHEYAAWTLGGSIGGVLLNMVLATVFGPKKPKAAPAERPLFKQTEDALTGSSVTLGQYDWILVSGKYRFRVNTGEVCYYDSTSGHFHVITGLFDAGEHGKLKRLMNAAYERQIKRLMGLPV